MKALTAAVVEAQLRKMELKLRQFEDLETQMDRELRKVRLRNVGAGIPQEAHASCLNSLHHFSCFPRKIPHRSKTRGKSCSRSDRSLWARNYKSSKHWPRVILVLLPLPLLVLD